LVLGVDVPKAKFDTASRSDGSLEIIENSDVTVHGIKKQTRTTTNNTNNTNGLSGTLIFVNLHKSREV